MDQGLNVCDIYVMNCMSQSIKTQINQKEWHLLKPLNISNLTFSQTWKYLEYACDLRIWSNFFLAGKGKMFLNLKGLSHKMEMSFDVMYG